MAHRVVKVLRALMRNPLWIPMKIGVNHHAQDRMKQRLSDLDELAVICDSCHVFGVVDMHNIHMLPSDQLVCRECNYPLRELTEFEWRMFEAKKKADEHVVRDHR